MSFLYLLLSSISLGFIGCVVGKRFPSYKKLEYIFVAGSLPALFIESGAPRQYVYQQVALFVVLLFGARAFLANRRMWIIHFHGLYDSHDKFHNKIISMIWVDMEVGLFFNGAWLAYHPNNYYWLIWLNLTKQFLITQLTPRRAA